MDDFSVRTHQLVSESEDIKRIARQIQNIGNVVSSVRSRLDWDVKQRAQINSTLLRIRENTVTMSSKTNLYGKALSECAKSYDRAEDRIVSNGGGVKGSGRKPESENRKDIPANVAEGFIIWMPILGPGSIIRPRPPILPILPILPRPIPLIPPLIPGFGPGRRWRINRIWSIYRPKGRIGFDPVMRLWTLSGERSKTIIPKSISVKVG